MRDMRIVIDLQGAQTASRHRGIGRYSLALALAMAKNKRTHEIFIVLNGLFPETIEPIRTAFSGVLPQDNIKVWFAPGPVRHIDPANDWRRHVAEVLRARFIASLKPDIIHITSMIEGYDDDAVHSIGVGDLLTIPTVVTLYDLIPLMQRDLYLAPHPRFESFYMERLAHLSRAHAFLAISDSSRQEVIDHLHAAPESVKNIYAAVDDLFKPREVPLEERVALRSKFGLTKPFLMYSGASDERKNHPRLIEAFSMLPADLRAKYQLAIVGRLPSVHQQAFEEKVKSCGLTANEVVITGSVSDQELVALYNMTELFVFPSWHEGFGLPALEAMACGAPVIGSSTSSVPEVIGRQDALFDPFDVQAICSKIAEVLTRPLLRQDLKQHGLQQAKLFSWNRSAELAMTALERWHEANNTRAGEVTQTYGSGESNPSLYTEIAHIPGAPNHQKSLDILAKAIVQNQPNKSQKQLLVDISELFQRDTKTGIQRVVRSIIAGLFAEPPDGYHVELVYTTPEAVGYRYARSFAARLNNDSTPAGPDDWVVPYSGDIFLGLDLSYLVLHQSLFFKHLREIGVHTHFVVYDILPMIAPELFPEHVVQIHTRWLQQIAQADGLVCISATVAQQVKTLLPEDASALARRPLAIEWFHLGADIGNSIPSTGLPAEAESMLAKLSGRLSFLMVGTLEPRKGLMQAILAFDLLWQRGLDLNLVLVGKPGWDNEALLQRIRDHQELGQRLFWFSEVSDEFLQKIYASSDCLIAASHHEGFGLPLIEAAQQKLPIIARDIAVFREVAGVHADYFPNRSEPEALAETVQGWMSKFEQQTHPRSEAMPWLTWKQSHAMLVSTLLSAVAK
jgi:glycosyltransferase involved in cell wall biosynthesis